MNLLIPVLICVASALVSSLLVYFLVFPRLPGFKLNKHKVIGGLIFAPLQGVTTAIGFGTALYAATLTSIITALGGGLAAVPIIFVAVIGGTAVIFFVANLLLILLYKVAGVFEIQGKLSMLMAVAALMTVQLIGCIISVICCIKMFAPDNTFSYIDKSGKVVIEKKFGSAYAFKNGKAKVTLISESQDAEKYIDHKGNIVAAPTEPEPEMHNKVDDDPSLYEGDGSWSTGHGSINTHGLKMLHFSEGLAPVCIKDESPEHKRLWGYIDKTGQFVIQPQYAEASSFSEGVAAVRK